MEVLDIVNGLRAVAWANTWSSLVTHWKHADEITGAMLRIGYAGLAGGGGSGTDADGDGEAAELL